MDTNQLPKIRVTFSEPQNGYWDGGKRSGGDFVPEYAEFPVLMGEHPGPGQIIRWGCFSLNFWFTCKSGRSWNNAARIALEKLKGMCNVIATMEVVYED